ncbi:MAG: hypothetical protein ACR2OC_09545 [Solirubrobacterales bacterium]
MAGAGASNGGATAKEPRSSCEQERYGSTYITSLRAKNTKCSSAKRVSRKFTACRKRQGGKNGKCNGQVAGYNCNEGNRNGVPGVQYDARVVCVNGSNKVVFTYTQNL